MQRDRTTASSIYITIYYISGGLGAMIPAGAWGSVGWRGVALEILCAQIVVALLAIVLRRTRAPACAGVLATAAAVD